MLKNIKNVCIFVFCRTFAAKIIYIELKLGVNKRLKLAPFFIYYFCLFVEQHARIYSLFMLVIGFYFQCRFVI
jgi:hypothetical protein